MKLCICGAEASWPHTVQCPYPLYNAPEGSNQQRRWLEAYKVRLEALAREGARGGVAGGLRLDK